MNRWGISVAAGCLLFSTAALVSGASQDAPFPLLSEEKAAEIRKLVGSMKADSRGPYARLRWYCEDGSIHPPAGSPCRDRGGGVQHAELSPAAARLRDLGFYVGTILQGLTYEEFVDQPNNHEHLRQLVVGRYLFEIDDGWVLRQARYYRGARQIEDEEAQGQRFLQRMLSDPDWVKRNFLLVNRLVAVVPHAASGGPSSERIRNLATEVAKLDPGFQPLRSKIHSFPSADDRLAVSRYLKEKKPGSPEQNSATALLEALDDYYDPNSLVASLEEFSRKLPDVEVTAELKKVLEAGPPLKALHALVELGVKVRTNLESGRDGVLNLQRADLLQLLRRPAQQSALQAVRQEGISKRDGLKRLAPLFRLAWLEGFLSQRERDSLLKRIEALEIQDSPAALDYKRQINDLSRSLDWARATARQAFGPTINHYLRVEPKVAGFSDSLLRGGIPLPMAQQLNRLSRDADRQLGQSHQLGLMDISTGVRGLNPGVARGRLRVVTTFDPNWRPQPDSIYVIPDTQSDLHPMAGILTLDAGNLLSHAQLLARNLGIPNAAIEPALVGILRELENRDVFFAVSPLGLVVLKEFSRLTAAERSMLAVGRQISQDKISLSTARIDLSRVDPIPLSRLRASDSGISVGPKAANLGQLKFSFPARVSEGVALPFGMFFKHIDRPFESQQTLIEEIRQTYRRSREMAAKGTPPEEVDAFVLAELPGFRRAIVELPWIPELRNKILSALRDEIGDTSKGVFVRSDTNAEDLPQFSGAGLNLTLPHRKGEESILRAVKEVWASPFADRAYIWRKQILTNQEDLFTSVLLLESVATDRSGVLITSGLETGQPSDLTIVTAEGVGGAVEGSSAETLLVDQKGVVRLLGQARASYFRRLNSEGEGVSWRPSAMKDSLLSTQNIQELLSVAERWRQLIPAQQRSWVWDIEFGFTADKLWLFQIRPFVDHRDERLLNQLSKLDGEMLRRRSQPVDLSGRMDN